jgi:hypothetical protein
MYSTGTGDFYPHEIEQSLRFNDDDSAYLTRTPASAGNRKTWTWSGWVKRGNLGSAQTILGANTTFVEFTSADKIQFDHNGTTVATSAVFRDPSAWYHVLVAVDTTQATAANRTEIYVNGTIQAVTGSYVSQNTDTDVNDATQHNIGANLTPAEYLDGYMAEVNFVDGSALNPTSFGQLKSDIWVPKEYTGSYGTTGYYLPFSDSAAIGDDLSGNANDWTPTNLASTDVVLDSPTHNWPTLNSNANSGLTLEEGNLRFTSDSSNRDTALATMSVASGKWYWELLVTANAIMVGIETDSLYPVSDSRIGLATDGYAWRIDTRDIFHDSATFGAYGAAVSSGDVVGVALDLDAGTLEFFLNNVSQGQAFSGITGAWIPAVSDSSNAATADGTLNFGQDSSFAGSKTAQGNTDANGVGDFYYTPPSGYLAVCAANLPAPAIDPAQDDAPADYFDVVLDTGANIKTSAEALFTNQFSWIKDRANTNNHQLIDSARGLTAVLQSNTSAAETTYSAPSGNSVALVWGVTGTGTSNTDGTITSTVSVNQKSGFSIVRYTGTGTASTVGHGLGAAPKMLLVKNRDQADDWQVYHGSNTASPETDYLILNTTAATADAADRWNDTLPTTAVFSIGTGVAVNTNTEDYVAYCFAEVEGFSKFGSYTGNGSADGIFVYCGFRPAFVMVKRTNSTGNWTILDNSREGYNVDNDPIYANLTSAEGTTDLTDLLSSGFKLRSTDASVNANGGTYIFAAFAEQPFKYSNAR